MEINIETPISIHLCVVDVDDYLGSFKMQINICLNRPERKLEYQGEHWFYYRSWDKFVDGFNETFVDERGLERVSPPETDLPDMDEDFCLKITNSRHLVIDVKRPRFLDVQMQANFQALLDHDQHSILVRKLQEFDRWWG